MLDRYYSTEPVIVVIIMIDSAVFHEKNGLNLEFTQSAVDRLCYVIHTIGFNWYSSNF